MKRDLKKTVALLGGLGVFVYAISCYAAEHDATLHQRAKQAVSDVTGRLPEAELQKLVMDLIGSDPTVARIAVGRFAELGATNVVALALEYPASLVQIEAAKRLKGSRGKQVVLSAVDALEVANNDLLKGGTEVVIANKRLKALLIDVICDATGRDPRDVSVEDQNSVQGLIGDRLFRESRQATEQLSGQVGLQLR